MRSSSSARGYVRAAVGAALVLVAALDPSSATPAPAAQQYATPAAAVVPGVAQDVSEAPVELVAAGPGAMSPQFAPLHRRYVINVPDPSPTNVDTWATIRNRAAGYVVGLVADGWTFDSVVRSDNNAWRGGWAFGDAQGCGWLLAANVDPKAGTPTTQCPVRGVFYADGTGFARSLNCAACSGGRAVLLTAAANEWSNVRPWRNPTAGPYIRLRTRPAGYCVEWRYVTRDGRWVLAKDRGVTDGDGSWTFMERTSFPPDLETNAAFQGQVQC